MARGGACLGVLAGALFTACGGDAAVSYPPSASLDGSYSLTFEKVELADSAPFDSEMQSPGRSLLVSFRESGQKTRALLSAPTGGSYSLEASTLHPSERHA